MDIYTREKLGENSKLEIFFLFTKEYENLTLEEY